ncbi:COR domain-containing protein [Neolewinella lacunae]|uniref:COR domain-containing protein n=1 Tax=Neolewinella lacunae TaxID=1517758 RepID=UPI001FE80341|nr:COR domain-containing protein [Neolewinella lacunae]MDN3633291.1 COR domain-containing protein [Neolewinella lacunae]
MADQERLGVQKAYEGRLMIVGEGKVGKTTLLHKLKDPTFVPNPDEPQTHGINIWRDWTFPVPGKEEAYSASVWDFGGQDIQHLTHQYFFTPGTVFLLVVNKRGNNVESEASQLNYWFRIIELMGRNAGQKARVLVVHNVFNSDKSHQGFNLGPYQERYAETLEISFQAVNLATQSGAFDDLRRDIQTALIELPGVGEKIIKGWPDIRRELGEMREERRISWKEFGKLCAPKGIVEEESKLLLTRYLARLGEILHYEHGGLLFDNVLLDIDWVTTAVYGITESQDIINRKGRFTREEIVSVWQKNGVTDPSNHELMLQLLQMDAFELCWKTEAGEYLTPTLFSAHEPAAPSVRPDLGVRFHYDYLPKGLLGQLIVRLHPHLEADHYWQEGVYLVREGCRARVSRPLADKDGERIIEIIVEGSAPRHYALLSLVVQELETIHRRSFPRISFEKEIPCPCERCRAGMLGQHYFGWNKLLELRNEGDPIAFCGNNRQTAIALLLEGFQRLEKQSPMNFAERIRQLVSSNQIKEALELLDRQYPSDAAALLSSDYRRLQDNQIMGVLSGEEERRVSAQIASRLLSLASKLGEQPSEQQQRKTIEAALPGLTAQLDRIEATGKDTNQKVTALGQILLHIGQEVENTREDLFVSRQEERQFMRKLEETVEQLPVPQQPGEAWYERPAKAKIKIALDLLAFVPGMSLKWEKELSKDGARVPRSWGEFKGWFLG